MHPPPHTSLQAFYDKFDFINDSDRRFYMAMVNYIDGQVRGPACRRC